MEKKGKSVNEEIRPNIAFTQWEKVAPKIGRNMIKFHRAIKRAEEEREKEKKKREE